MRAGARRAGGPSRADVTHPSGRGRELAGREPVHDPPTLPRPLGQTRAASSTARCFTTAWRETGSARRSRRPVAGASAEVLDDPAAGGVGERGEDAVRRDRAGKRTSAAPRPARARRSAFPDASKVPTADRFRRCGTGRARPTRAARRLVGTHQNVSRRGASNSSTTPTRSPSGPRAWSRPPGSGASSTSSPRSEGSVSHTSSGAAGSSISRSTLGGPSCATHGLHISTRRAYDLQPWSCKHRRTPPARRRRSSGGCSISAG